MSLRTAQAELFAQLAEAWNDGAAAVALLQQIVGLTARPIAELTPSPGGVGAIDGPAFTPESADPAAMKSLLDKLIPALAASMNPITIGAPTTFQITPQVAAAGGTTVPITSGTGSTSTTTVFSAIRINGGYIQVKTVSVLIPSDATESDWTNTTIEAGSCS